jgi:hypothetical protein
MNNGGQRAASGRAGRSVQTPIFDELALSWRPPQRRASGASKGISATAYADLVALLKNDVVASVSTFDVLTPFDSTLRDQLVKTVAGRMT